MDNGRFWVDWIFKILCVSGLKSWTTVELCVVGFMAQVWIGNSTAVFKNPFISSIAASSLHSLPRNLFIIVEHCFRYV